jgi:hypothetical protein
MDLTYENKPKRRKKKQILFNPDIKFVEAAVRKYINQGGKITKIDSIPNVTRDYGFYQSSKVINLPAMI